MIANRSALPDLPLPAVAMLLAAALLAILVGAGIGAGTLAVVVVVAGPLALVAAWKLPGVFFALYLAIPFYKGSIDAVLPVDATAALAALCGVAALETIAPALAGRWSRRRWWVLVRWSFPGLVLVGGAFYSPNPDALAVAAEFVLLVTLAMLVAFRVAPDPRYRRQFLVTLFALGMVTVAVGLTELGTIGRYDRLTTLGTNTIGAARASLMVPLIGFTAGWAVPVWRPFILVLTAPALLVAVSTGSRGPLLFCVVTLLAMALLIGVSAGQRLVRSLALAAGVVAVMAAPLPAQIAALVPRQSALRITELGASLSATLSGEEATFDTSSQARIDAWNLAIDLFQQRPVFGWGTDSFELFTPAIGLPDVYTPHNLTLQVAMQWGIVGLVAVGAVILPALRAAFRPADDPTVRAFAALTIFKLLETLVGGTISDDRMMLGMVLLMLVIAADRRH